MCHERWARARAEAVETTYLRGLRQREREDAPAAEPAQPLDEDALTPAEPVVVAALSER